MASAAVGRGAELSQEPPLSLLHRQQPQQVVLREWVRGAPPPPPPPSSHRRLGRRVARGLRPACEARRVTGALRPLARHRLGGGGRVARPGPVREREGAAAR